MIGSGVMEAGDLARVKDVPMARCQGMAGMLVRITRAPGAFSPLAQFRYFFLGREWAGVGSPDVLRLPATFAEWTAFEMEQALRDLAREAIVRN